MKEFILLILRTEYFFLFCLSPDHRPVANKGSKRYGLIEIAILAENAASINKELDM